MDWPEGRSCSLPFSDEHADEAAGGSQLLQPPELRQRLQQQQPSRRHPGLVPGVNSVTGSGHGACPPPPGLAPLHLLPLHHPEDALLSQPGRSMSAAGTPSPRSSAQTWVQPSRASPLGLLPSTVRTALSPVSFKSLLLPCCCDLPKSLKILLGKGPSPLKRKGLNMETPLEVLKPNSILPRAAQRQRDWSKS